MTSPSNSIRPMSRARPWRIACVVVLTVAAATATAADGTWDRPGDGVWTNPTSWLGGVPNGVGETAFFGPDAPSRPSAVIQLNEPITVGAIDHANANRIRLTGPGPLVFDAVGPGTPVVIDLRQDAGVLNIGTPIVLIDDPLTVRAVNVSEVIFSGLYQGGSGDLTKEGAGGLAIGEAAGDWTGRLLVTEGTVEIRDSSGLGAGSGTLADGTIVSVDGALAIARNVTIADERVRLDGGAISGDRFDSATFNGPLELAADSRATNRGADGTLNLGGAIEGPGGLSVDRGIVELWGATQFGGPLTVAGAVVGIRSAAAHGGSRVGAGGVMKVRSSGSLVDAGLVTVEAGGELRIVAPAGSDPSTSSVSPSSILLEGGTLTLARIDFSPSGLLAPASQGGVLLLEKLPTYTAGGTNVIDFDAIGGRDLRLGAKTDATLPDVALLPESATTTLRFGGGPATLTVESTIKDTARGATHVQQAGGGTTVLVGVIGTTLAGVNSYTGMTTVESGTLVVAHWRALGASQGDASGTIVSPNGTLAIMGGDVPILEPITLDGGTLEGRGIALGGKNARLIGPINLLSDTRVYELSSRQEFQLAGIIRGPGGLEYDGGEIVVSGDNTYDGVTRITAGSVFAQSSSALGSTQGNTVVTGGLLQIEAPTAEDLAIRGAELWFAGQESQPYTGTVTLADGELNLWNVETFSAPVVLEQGTAIINGSGTRITGGITGEGNLELGGQTTSIVVDGAPLAHQGDLTVRLGTTLNSANSYTGKTSVRGGSLVVNHPDALGTATTPVRVVSGSLTLNVPVDRDLKIGPRRFDPAILDVPDPATTIVSSILLDSGVIRGAGTFAGSITVANSAGISLIGGGTFRGNIAGDGVLMIHGAREDEVNLESANTFRGITQIGAGTTNLNHVGAIDPNRTIVTGGRLNLNIPIEAPITVTDNRATLAFNTRQDFSFPWAIDSGFIEASTELGMSQLIFQDSGAIIRNGAGTLRIDDELRVMRELLGIDGLSGAGTIRHFGSKLSLRSDLPDFDGEIVISNGRVAVSTGAALGSTQGATHVLGSSGNAWLDFSPNGDAYIIEEDIYLHNTHGPNGRGALQAELNSNEQPTLRGRIDVGDQGSTMRGTFIIEGTLTGNNATLLAPRVTIRTEQSDLQGTLDVIDGRVTLDEDGQLYGLDAIALQNASLVLDNTAKILDTPSINLPDRVDDAVEIRSRGGEIVLRGPRDEEAAETLGVLRLEYGRTTVGPDRYGDDTPVPTLTLSELVRDPGAAVTFDTREGVVRITNAPPLKDGMIGGWALTRSGFATLGPGGIETVAATSNDLNSAGPSDHVRLSAGQTLATDVTIASLVIDSHPEDLSLDLGGNMLTIESGGLFQVSGRESLLSNGRLTAGGQENKELAVSGGFPSRISAAIIDNPAGGAVAFTVTDGTVRLTGDNYYTGGTWIVGRLDIKNPASIPANDRVHVDAGTYDLRLNADTTVALDELHLRGGGRVMSSGAVVDATRYFLEEGQLDVPLRGSGTIVKETRGTVSITQLSPLFDGSVELREGILVVTPGVLGSAAVMLSGGQLNAAGSLPHDIVLDGGTLATSRSDYSAEITGNIVVASPSRLFTFADGSNLEILGDVTGDAQLVVNGSVDDDYWAIYSALRGDNSGFSGGVRVESGTFLVVEPGGAGTGPIEVLPGARLTLGRSRTDAPSPDLDNSIALRGGSMIGLSVGNVLTGDVTVVDDAFIGAIRERGLTIAGRLILSDGSHVFGLGDDFGSRIPAEPSVDISGQLLVGADTTWSSLFHSMAITGEIRSNAPSASVDFVGPADLLQLAEAGVYASEGQSLRVLINGEAALLAIAGEGNVVSGNGTLGNDITVRDGAAISPGASAGLLTIGGDTVIGPDGWLEIELGGTRIGDTYDSLDVTGAVTLGGLLDVSLIDGFLPSADDAFLILSAESIEGVFANAVDSIVVGDLELPVTYRSNMVILGNASAIPEPTSLLLLIVGLLLVGGRRRDHGTHRAKATAACRLPWSRRRPPAGNGDRSRFHHSPLHFVLEC